MKKQLLIILCGLTGLACATANSGAYLGLEVGAANQSLDFNQSAFNLNTGSSNVVNTQLNGIGRFYSGYNLDKYTGFEAGLSYSLPTGYSYPNSNGTFNSGATVFDISYIPMLPIADSKWSAFGRIGVNYTWLTGDSNDCGCSNNISGSGSSFADVLGAGMRYRFNNHWTYKIEWIADGLLFPIGINNGNTAIGLWSQQTFQTGVSFHF